MVRTLEWDIPRPLLTGDPAWKPLVATILQDPELAASFPAPIEPPQEAHGRGHLETIVAQLLPQPLLSDEGSVYIEPMRVFASRYRALEATIASKTRDYLTIWPILGCRFPRQVVQLDEVTSIRQLSIREYLVALNSSVVDFGRVNRLDFTPENAFALAVVTSLPKESPTGDLKVQPDDSVPSAIQELTQKAWSVAELPPLDLSARVTFSNPWDDGCRYCLLRHPVRFFGLGTSVQVSWQQARRFTQVWRDIASIAPEKNKALHLASQRLSYLDTRPRLTDQLLDLLIAAEALYLIGIGNEEDRGELKFRLALLAAKWSDRRATGLSQQQVFETMRLAYNARSSVAHGNEPNPKDLRIMGEAVTLDQLLSMARTIVAHGLRKAIRMAAQHPKRAFVIHWNDLLFPAPAGITLTLRSPAPAAE